MNRLFKLGLIIGFAGTLAAAYFVPWISYARYASEASVVANGGRSERFVIRMPDDVIYAADADTATLRSQAFPAAMGLGTAASEFPTRIEQFKLRDVQGNVLGLASRHWTYVDTGATTSWLLVIPSRGAISFTGAGEAQGALSDALSELGWQEGRPFTGSVGAQIGDVLESVTTSGEFSGLEIDLTETWAITGVDASGQIQGTIELNTIGRRAP